MAGTVEAAFNELIDRQRLTSNQVTVANARVNALREFFDRNFTMAEPVFTAGSFARGTICSGQKDIDLLAPLHYPTYRDQYDDSRAFLYHVRNKLNDHYHATTVSSRQVAVVLNFQTITADVVPCFQRSGGGYCIPNGNGGWTETNPRYHTQEIAKLDNSQNGRFKCLARLIKAWNLANRNHLRSFHVELMVYKMWANRNIRSIWPQVICSTLQVMPGWVEAACNDIWNETRVDGYLSSNERYRVVHMLQEDAVTARKAEELRGNGRIQLACDRWNSIYRSTFPAFG